MAAVRFSKLLGLFDPSQDFSRVLAQQMDYFSNNPNADKLNKVKSDLDQLQTYALVIRLGRL